MIEHPVFKDIYDEFYARILLYLKRLVGENDAEELAQIVFEKISRKLGSYRGEAKVSTWVYRIATNAALDKLKSSSFKYSPAGPLAPFPIHVPEVEGAVSRSVDNPETLDKKIIRNEMNQCIREFVDRLPPSYRTVITLNELEGFSSREVADILGVSLETAKIRLHRARGRLKESLRAGCDFYYNDCNELACDRKQPEKK